MALPSGLSEHLDVPIFNRTMSIATSEHQKDDEKKSVRYCLCRLLKMKNKKESRVGASRFLQKNERVFSPAFKKSRGFGGR